LKKRLDGKGAAAKCSEKRRCGVRGLRQTLRRTRGVHGLLALAFLFAGAAVSLAQPSMPPLSAEAIEKMRKTKAPEDWTTEERLAVRFDPGDISRRRKASREDLKKSNADLPEVQAARAVPPEAGNETNNIVGQRNPELFLPTEIFDSLIQHAFLPVPEMRESYRRTFEEGFQSAGFSPEAFWPTLTAIAKDTIQAHKEYYEISRKLGKATAAERKALSRRIEEIGAGLCVQRAAELEAARQRFGRKAFDRFLYRTVAPTMFQVMSSDPEWSDHLRQMEGGCHAAK
jgi:hypothetical protein